MVLGKLPVSGRPTIWITVGQGPTALTVRAGGGCLDIFTLIYPLWGRGWLVGWLVGCFGFNGPLRQYFSLYRAVSQREGEPYNLDYSRARAYCAYSRCGWGLFGHFYSHVSFLSSFSLSLGDGPIKTEILSQTQNNQPNNCNIMSLPDIRMCDVSSKIPKGSQVMEQTENSKCGYG